jgi:hypothetical protein
MMRNTLSPLASNDLFGGAIEHKSIAMSHTFATWCKDSMIDDRIEQA